MKRSPSAWSMKWSFRAKKCPACPNARQSPLNPIHRRRPTTQLRTTEPNMARPTQITLCSFCGKSHAEVKKLIQGPGVYICDNCVLVCKNVLDKELRSETTKKTPAPRINLLKPAEIKRQLDHYCIGQEQAKKTLAVAVHNHYKRIAGCEVLSS